MPASTIEPVSAALRTALSKNSLENNLDNQLAGSTKKALLSNIEFDSDGSYQSTVLDKLKSKYIVLKSVDSKNNNNNNSSKGESMGGDENLTLAKHELFPLHAVQLGWNNSDWSVGAGMVNMGNTCYLNSTLQALFHVPALVNWLVSDKQHSSECVDSGTYCIICAMRKTLLDSQQRNANSIRPFHIYNKLRLVCRNLIPGRQEDAHEFLRYLVEAMEKSFLKRFKNCNQFDSRTKETTPLNQILGGYLRSTVRCLDCGHVSTTFQHFQDVLIDIRKAQTLDEALDAYFSREHLDDDSYHCESCKKKVPATKQFFLERAPMVLCIQLKRFSVTNNKITKHLQFRQRLELTKYARNKPNIPLVYRLVALVTHMGPTVSCGHYTAVAQAPCGNFYQFDDSMVRPISHQAVFSTNAYIMLYELERSPYTQKASPNGINKGKIPTSTKTPEKNATASTSNKPQLIPSPSTNNSSEKRKVYGPELPPSKMPRLEDQNGTVTSTLNGKHEAHSSSSETPTKTSPLKERSVTPTKPVVIETKKSSPIKNTGSTTAPARSLNGNSSTRLSPSNSFCNPSSTQDSPKDPIVSSSTQVMKLVPYEEDDSSSNSSSADEEEKVCAKAANGDWKVSSSTDNVPTNGGKRRTPWEEKSNTVNELLKLSHGGYAAPVSNWNGNRAQLDKEVNNEKREERKRALSSNSEDQGRVKHVKNNNGYKSNPGYNRVQEYHNVKNWSQNNNNYQVYSGEGRHRRRNNFHHKNFKSYRFRP